MRGRAVLMASALLVAAVGLFAGVLLNDSSSGAGGHSDSVRKVGTRDGRLLFSVPADWVQSECELPQDGCLVIRPAGAGLHDRISVLWLEPNRIEGDPTDLFFMTDPPAPTPDGVERLTIDGQQAVRFDRNGDTDPGSSGKPLSGDAVMVAGLLPTGDGSKFVVMCNYDRLEKEIRAGCDTVVKTFRLPAVTPQPSPTPAPTR